MATKNLARTIIEGGRDGYSRWQRRHSHAQERAMAREALDRLAREDDLDELVIPARVPVHRGFADKLGAPRRWLGKQVGRPWDVVRRELFQLFDTRTTAGRHIVFDHMLPWVQVAANELTYRARFVVDGRGILRGKPRIRYRSPWERAPLPCAERRLEAWLAGRRVGARGDVLFWFTPTVAGGFRQHLRLDEGDGALWRSLPAWFRERHQAAS